MVAGQSTITASVARGGGSRSLKRRRGWSELAIEGVIRVVALLSIAAILLILLFVGKEALPLLTSVDVHREVTFGGLFAPAHASGGGSELLYSWQPVSEVPKYNVLPLIVGSLKVTLVSLVFAVPLSVGAAIFVSEYANPRVRELVKPAIE